jgi:hypothetical protein
VQGASAGRLSRAGVAKLDVSIGTARNMEKDGRLHPTLQDGINVFDSQEVATLKTEREREGAVSSPPTSASEGEIAAACFSRFAQGKTVVEVVQDLKLPPGKVRGLLREFLADDLEPASLPAPPTPDGESYRSRLKPDIDKLPPPPSAPVKNVPVHPRTKAAARRR